jgi:hypothetical protein
MLSVELKGSFIVIKYSYFPGIGSMAAQAAGSPVRLKLTIMVVGVAACAVRRHIGKLLHHFSFSIFPEMAGPAGLLFMWTGEGKCCF